MDRPLLFLTAAKTEIDTSGEARVCGVIAAAEAMGADW
jgi:hypothetical protein